MASERAKPTSMCEPEPAAPAAPVPEAAAPSGARRKLLGLGLYVAPAVIGSLVISRSAMAQASCGPSACLPEQGTCSPKTCAPKNK